MQPLRGYDLPWLGDPLQGFSPDPFSPPNMAAGAWSDPIGSSSPPIAPQMSTTPSRKSGITRESLAALKQAMVRIAPHLPPDLLRRHYINRLAELSNPTPTTLYPVLSYDSPVPAAGPLGGIKPSPLPVPNMSSAMDSSIRSARQPSSTLESGANRGATGAAIGSVIGGLLGRLGGAAVGTVIEPGGGTLAGGTVGRAEGAALGSWIGRNVGSAAETAILSMSRARPGSTPKRDSTPKRARTNKYDVECERQYEADIAGCQIAHLLYGDEGYAICTHSAADRYSECLRGGVGAIKTRLAGVQTPL